MKAFMTCWIALAMLFLIGANANGCCTREDRAEGREGCQARVEKVKPWKKLENTRATTFVTQVPIQLPNGRSVFCVWAGDGLWCDYTALPGTPSGRPVASAPQTCPTPAPAPIVSGLNFGRAE